MKFARRLGNKFFLIAGIIILVLALFSGNIFANTIDNIDVVFDKDEYIIPQNISSKIGYRIYNNNEDIVNLLVYSECDEDDDVECTYSKHITLQANSSQTGSFYVIGSNDEESDVRLYVVDMIDNNSNYFSVDLTVEEDADEGEFDVEVIGRKVCIGRNNTITLDIDNSYKSGLYDLTLYSNLLSINLKQSNPVYLPKDDKEIEFLVYVPETLEIGGQDIRLTIKDNNVTVLKDLSLILEECDETPIEFSVSGDNYQSHNIEKGQVLKLNYNVLNHSNQPKHVYVAEFHEDILEVEISDRDLLIQPNDRESVEISIVAPINMDSGDYDLNLSFFDGIDSIFKKVRLIVEPEYYLDARLLQQGLVSLDMGSSVELRLVFTNNGDISEDIVIDYVVGNDLDVSISNDSFRINPNNSVMIPVIVSAGSDSIETITTLRLNVSGENSGYSKQFSIDIQTFRGQEPVTIEFLSFPNELDVDANSSKEFDFEISNFGNEDIVLERIELIGLPQEFTYTLPNDISLPSQSSKVISGTLFIGDIEPQEFSANLMLISRNGGVLTKPITVKIVDATDDDDDNDDPSGFTGLFGFQNSLLIGIIVASVLTIMLFAFRIVKKAPLKTNI